MGVVDDFYDNKVFKNLWSDLK